MVALVYHEPDFLIWNVSYVSIVLLSFLYLGWSPLNSAELYAIVTVAHNISVNIKEQVYSPGKASL